MWLDGQRLDSKNSTSGTMSDCRETGFGVVEWGVWLDRQSDMAVPDVSCLGILGFPVRNKSPCQRIHQPEQTSTSPDPLSRTRKSRTCPPEFKDTPRPSQTQRFGPSRPSQTHPDHPWTLISKRPTAGSHRQDLDDPS